ncbi:uncharacterized protein LOC125041740 [Penaeus chinensis]|uniref:uncharacterized protein LOC125041740 n=1 Tax=Penaeus chinensis TaxID=139456 RepID=UPI001FB6BCFA|nr:uncharacterized protein LOC125041740 [Penaeus chinensis]
MKVLLLHVSLVLLLAGSTWSQCIQRSYRNVNDCLAKRIFAPVCGTDGCTYPNEDVLNCAVAEDRANLPEDQVVRIAFFGRCEDKVSSVALNMKEGEERSKEGEDEMKEGEKAMTEGMEEEKEEGSSNRLFP